MNKPNILIVEDEILIASDIQVYLNNNGFNIIDIAVSYDEAVNVLANSTIDFVLIDINLSGTKTGIDLAHYINQNHKLPFIYLTSYSDKESIENLKTTNPIGYQPKPVHKIGLLTALELHFNNVERKCLVSVESGSKTYNFLGSEIKYVQASHIYTIVYTIDNEYVIRITLKKFLERIPSCCSLVRINRSTAINSSFVSTKTKTTITIDDQSFPISKSYSSSI